jgi:hypothetical protein
MVPIRLSPSRRRSDNAQEGIAPFAAKRFPQISWQIDRRDLVWINATANPTAEWVARQITEAFPWDEAPRHLIRDRDRIYGSVVTRRSGQAYRTSLALAERVCRTVDRIDPA